MVENLNAKTKSLQNITTEHWKEEGSTRKSNYTYNNSRPLCRSKYARRILQSIIRWCKQQHSVIIYHIYIYIYIYIYLYRLHAALSLCIRIIFVSATTENKTRDLMQEGTREWTPAKLYTLKMTCHKPPGNGRRLISIQRSMTCKWPPACGLRPHYGRH